MSDRLRGTLIGFLSVIVLSPDSLFIRLIDTDSWTLVLWRGAGMAVAVIVALLVKYGSGAIAKTRAIGWPGVGVVACFAVSSILFVLAVQHTTVANTLAMIRRREALQRLQNEEKCINLYLSGQPKELSMPSLQVRDLPAHIYHRLLDDARRQHRSLAQQAVATLARGLESVQDQKTRRRQLLDAIQSDGAQIKKQTEQLPHPVDVIREDRER